MCQITYVAIGTINISLAQWNPQANTLACGESLRLKRSTISFAYRDARYGGEK